jgi:hypothetical protein
MSTQSDKCLLADVPPECESEIFEHFEAAKEALEVSEMFKDGIVHVIPPEMMGAFVAAVVSRSICQQRETLCEPLLTLVDGQKEVIAGQKEFARQMFELLLEEMGTGDGRFAQQHPEEHVSPESHSD